MSIKFVSSVVFVKDIQVSRRFYETLLNMTVEFDFGPNIAFAGGLSLWALDHLTPLLFNQPAPLSSAPLGAKNWELCFEAEELDDILARLATANVRFVHPLREEPWGQRVIRFYDPDEHIIEIGEPMHVVVRRMLRQGLPAEEVAARSSMPLVFVQEVAGNG